MNTGEQTLAFNKICLTVVGAQATYFKTKKAADMLRWNQAFKEAFDSLQTVEEKVRLSFYAPPTKTIAFNSVIDFFAVAT